MGIEIFGAEYNIYKLCASIVSMSGNYNVPDYVHKYFGAVQYYMKNSLRILGPADWKTIENIPISFLGVDTKSVWCGIG